MQNVDKYYGKNKVLDNVSFSVEKGHIVGLIGPNGAGKTTIMKIISGLAHRSNGEFKLFEASRGIHVNRGRMSFMIESPIIDISLNARRNMEYMRLLRGVADKNRINELLTYVGLEEAGKKPVKNFSLGMKQRLGIAMSLLADPEVLVLDEPVNGLDPEGIVEVRLILKELCEKQGKTIIISSHLLSELSELCTDYIIINHGKIVEALSTEELMMHSRSYISVKTDNISHTTATLENRLNIKDYKVVDDTELRIFGMFDRVAEVSHTITDGGDTILHFALTNESLEEYYLSKVDHNKGEKDKKRGSVLNKLSGRSPR
ncbi:MAG: ABC transporter ATP-binding protein [Eubacterium sp.]|nr:ABC transporter ATP-binding protein [Eubacterium sp.]MBR1674943.1 ABC transporter ATP-binding protein [Eubacterium sp.]